MREDLPSVPVNEVGWLANEVGGVEARGKSADPACVDARDKVAGVATPAEKTDPCSAGQG